VLVKLEYASPEDVAQAMAEFHKIPFVDLRQVRIPEGVIELVPESVARENMVIPYKDEDGALTILIADPFDLETIEKLRFILNRKIETALAPKEAINGAINRYYGQVEGESADSMLQEFTDTAIDFTETESGDETGGEAAVVDDRTRLADMLAEDFAKGPVKEMGGCVIVFNGAPPLAFNLRFDSLSDRKRSAKHSADMGRDTPEGRLGIVHLKEAAFRGQYTGIAHLTSHFGIEGGFIEDDGALFSLGKRFDKLPLFDKCGDFGLAVDPLVAEEFGGGLPFEQAFFGNLLSFFVSRPRPLARLFFKRFIPLEVDIEAAVFSQEKDFFDRKSVRVFHFERVVAGDVIAVLPSPFDDLIQKVAPSV